MTTSNGQVSAVMTPSRWAGFKLSCSQRHSYSSCVGRNVAHMNTIFSSLQRVTRLSAIALVAVVLNASAASAQSPLQFAVLGGTAVTCTGSLVIGDVGVWPMGLNI